MNWQVLPAVSMPLDLLSYILLTISVRRRKKDGGDEASIGYFAAALAASAATVIYGFAKGDPWLYATAIVSGIGQSMFFFGGLVAKKTFSRTEKMFCLGLVAALVCMKFTPNLIDLFQFAIGLSKFVLYFLQRSRIKQAEEQVEIPTASLALFATCGALMSAYGWHACYWAPALGVTFFCLGQLDMLRKRFAPKKDA